MKSLWSFIGVLAVAHLLALAGLGAWLVGTDRLDGERLERVRTILSETIPEEKARLAEEADAAEQARILEAAKAAEATMPIGAADRVQLKLELSEIDRQQFLRMQREMQDLKLSLTRERQLLDDDVVKFQTEKADFDAYRKRLLEIEGSAQFKKTLATYEGLKAKDAMASLNALLEQDQQDQVVSYLSAMEERQRTKIIAEFNKLDPTLAADLLERLRTRGTELLAPGEPDPNE